MENNKEVTKKPYTDAYESKRVNVPKSNYFKNNTHVHPRVDDTKNYRVSNLSRSKNNLASVSKKSSNYSCDAKSLYKHSSEECGIKRNSNLIVNAVPIDHPITERKLEHCHSLNGNLFNVHPTLWNLACPVPEISHLNRVLSFQPARHNELSFSKCGKHKQRNILSEQRGFNYKNPTSSNVYQSSKFSAPTNCNTRCQCSKNNSWNASNVDPYFNLPTNESVSENIVNEDYSLKCELKCSPNNTLPKDCENLADLPILVNSNISKDSWEVNCLENKLRVNSKQRKWNSKPWGQVAKSTDRSTIDARSFDKADKMLFPALPSNSHSQVKLNSSHTNSMPPSEHSSADNSDLESVNSFPEGNNCTAPSFLTSVSSTIPQASYADVIRMSSAGVQGLLASDFEKTSDQNLSHNAVVNSLNDRLQKEENGQPGSSDWVISRLSQLDQNSADIVNNVSLAQPSQNEQNFGTPRPIVVSLEKPSFYNSSLQSNKNVLSTFTSHTNLTSPERKVMEPENLIPDCLCSIEKISLDKVTLPESVQTACTSDVPETNIPGTSLNTNSVYSSPSSIDSFSDAFKSAESNILNACNYSKTNDPPVVIMNNSSLQSMPEISFGIEYEEMIKLCADSCDTSVKSLSSFSLQDADECSFSEENIQSPEANPESSKVQAQCESGHCTSSVEASTDDQCITIKGKKIYWKDLDVGNKYNHQQMAEYFASVWKEFEDCTNDAKGTESVKYYEL